eukprot:Hpha_TRINITY_DN13118_c0_g1::TRINITY_DN13118_c0_g1_i1::g.113776::m.113776
MGQSTGELVANAVLTRVHANPAPRVLGPHHKLAHFSFVEVPPVTVAQFVRALHEHVKPVEWVTSLILVDRLMVKLDHQLSPYNVHRLLLTGVVIGTKLHRDHPGLNRLFAALCDMELEDLNTMERLFISMLEWDIFVGETDYKLMTQGLESSSSKMPRRVRENVHSNRLTSSPAVNPPYDRLTPEAPKIPKTKSGRCAGRDSVGSVASRKAFRS